MANVAKQIIGSFEDIGKDIVRETVSLPGEILGMGKPKPKQPPPQSPQEPQSPQNRVVPREWLAELAGKGKKQKEPTVQEIHEKENQEKNEKEAKEAAVVQKMAPIQTGGSKPKRGTPYGVKQKSTAVENKSSRSD
jgi:hypothetical protein